MSKTVIISTTGFDVGKDGKICENIAEVDRNTLDRYLPQMLSCLFDPLVPQIEDPEHPLNGWQIMAILIMKPDDWEDFPELEE
jgi:hypothetical protein